MTTNIASKGTNEQRGLHSNTYNNYNNEKPRQQQSNNKPRNYNNSNQRSNQGDNSHRSSNYQKDNIVVCQLCNYHGHTIAPAGVSLICLVVIQMVYYGCFLLYWQS
uniref:Uncharacterized protein n=1 Tax=Nelumbo nucifera TaxID=4432 RepID=A0A822ZKU6_NELNU|nr:TPA_asm: hypothetical protein HUJ06_003737 [Nelumbo nucifera]